MYASERLAHAYATFRPPVHRTIVERALRSVSLTRRVHTAIDAGCGVGLSTVPLLAHAVRVVGVEPSSAMIKHAPGIAPGAHFVTGCLEALPIASRSADLLTAAGALNYCDLPAALAEVSRVLVPDGLFLAYDFSAGERLSVESELPAQYAKFRMRFPSGAGYALDLRLLPAREVGLAVVAYEQFVVQVQMPAQQYLSYVLSESGVALALAGGMAADEARVACAALFGPVFEAREATVEFDALFAVWRRTS